MTQLYVATSNLQLASEGSFRFLIARMRATGTLTGQTETNCSHGLAIECWPLWRRSSALLMSRCFVADNCRHRQRPRHLIVSETTLRCRIMVHTLSMLHVLPVCGASFPHCARSTTRDTTTTRRRHTPPIQMPSLVHHCLSARTTLYIYILRTSASGSTIGIPRCWQNKTHFNWYICILL